MSVTYTDTYADTDRSVDAEAYVPVYARKRRTGGGAGRGGVKAWMILAPLGVVTVGGVAAAMMMTPSDEQAAPVAAAPAVEAPPLPTLLAVQAEAPVAAETSAATPAPVTVAAEAPPAAPVQRRAAPVERRAAPTASAPAAQDAGDEATADLNRAQAARTTAPAAPTTPAASATPATPSTTTPRTPDIAVQPLSL